MKRGQEILTPVDEWYDADTPEVSVIVLNFNASDLTVECLQALWANTYGHRYEILVVDNGSLPEDRQKLVGASRRFRLITLPENLYFGAGSNVGAAQARGRFLVFLNNDAFVTPAWLSPLIGLLNDVADAGAVGPRFISPDGRLQEAGAFIDELGNSVQVGRSRPYHSREELEIRIVDYCSAACLAISKHLFIELGGFDPIYLPGYYEDVDLCFKIGARGKFIYYHPDSTVVHIGNATSSKMWSPDELSDLVSRNREKFMLRWGEWLRARRCEGEGPTA